ncbi:MAG: histidine kinase [Rubritepida sp.]|nr:histidine kinase [Rubritepida sp.]
MGPEADTLRLQRALRDLVALSTVPAAWVGREPPAIAAGLADVLVSSLYLDFAFVRLCDPDGGATVEIARGNAWRAFPEWLRQYFTANDRLSRRQIVRDIGGGKQGGRGIVIPVGVDAEGGLVAAACDRADFPSEIDQLLLSVAANHAATAFRMARLVQDHRRAEEALRESERQLRRARDELETKVAERTTELQRSEAYLAAAQRLSHAGSFGWDVSSGKLYWSEETFRIFECDRADQPTVDLALQRTHPYDRARVQQTLDRATQDRKGLDFEYRLLMPDGKIKNIHIVGHPVFDESGDFVEFVGTVMDVTERRRAEEERQALAHASRVATMGQLTASIAHEVSQPIAATVTNAQAALRWLGADPPDLEEVREALDRIVKDGRRAGDVIGRIRALVEKSPARKADLEINEAILEVTALLHGEVVKHGVSMQTRLAEGLPLIHGDRVQLQQVILNLIINAIEAVRGVSEGTRELLVSTEQASGDGVLVAVRDSGPGLDPAKLEWLFEAFYTTKPGGLGMGLSICRSIIEAHRGRLWASANTPRGAIFQFALPRHAMEVQPEQPLPAVAITAGPVGG